MRRLGVLVLAAMLAGCSSSGTLRSSNGLPTWDPGAFCDTAALIGPIHVDPRANPPTWVGSGSSGLYLEWPTGFSLREVSGEAAVVDPSGQVIVTQTRSNAGAIGGGVGQNRPGWFAICQVGGRSYAKGS